jgi:hypothetical protein
MLSALPRPIHSSKLLRIARVRFNQQVVRSLFRLVQVILASAFALPTFVNLVTTLPNRTAWTLKNNKLPVNQYVCRVSLFVHFNAIAVCMPVA